MRTTSARDCFFLGVGMSQGELSAPARSSSVKSELEPDFDMEPSSNSDREGAAEVFEGESAGGDDPKRDIVGDYVCTGRPIAIRRGAREGW